ncbi:hypothetical protein SCLCIDRAFT_1217356 [Scleroderma citrinum Foug A]|uniref:Uncharacterized protein n=1 Tax=Scleroderma citrinum Foug A TaxID=1036808 RepID=A0A0C2ZDP6_9AGAM|nr:hypothetical protein SCLCIDRAFT_1217356 [Scleroderma citrinum Foug A]
MERKAIDHFNGTNVALVRLLENFLCLCSLDFWLTDFCSVMTITDEGDSDLLSKSYVYHFP